MKLIVDPKTKQQERKVRIFLEDHSIDYIKVEEEAAVFSTKKKIRENLGIKKEKIKSKLINEIKEAVNEMKLIKSGKKKAHNAEDFLNEL